MAIRTAPVETSSVPPSDHVVKGSPRINVAHIELNTRPDACNVDSTGSGSVVIWIVLPTRFEKMNIAMPSCHRRRMCGGRRSSCGPFSSSNMCDFRCRVRPKLCTDVDTRPTKIPICIEERAVSDHGTRKLRRTSGKLTATLPSGDRPPRDPITQTRRRNDSFGSGHEVSSLSQGSAKCENECIFEAVVHSRTLAFNRVLMSRL